MRLTLALTLMAAPAFADVETALSEHILPGHAALTEQTAALATAAGEDCTSEALRPAFHEAYDAWIRVAHIQFGPIEDEGLSLALHFWPDPKDSTGKALGRLTRAEDAIVNDAAEFKQVSAAAQGFTALERMLYDPQMNAGYACALTQAIAAGLALKSEQIDTAWPAFAELMLQADNTRFQSDIEVSRSLYTALSTGLEFLHDQRLGRPLGTFERPRPRRAEARRSERSQRHVVLALTALNDLAGHVAASSSPKTDAAFARAIDRASRLDDPSFAGVADPAKRFKIEALQREVREIQIAVIEEIGTPLGVSAGFNALDGD